MEKSPRLQNFEANKAAHQAEVDAANQEAFEASLYKEAGVTDFTETDQNPDAVYPEEQQNAKRQLEEGNAYAHHLERLASGVDRQEELFNKPSAALKHDAAMFDEAVAMNDAFDTQRHEATQAEAAQADAAFEAKLATSPKLRRMDMVSQEVHNLDNEIKALQNRTDLENEAEISAKIDTLKERRGELDVKLLELMEEYKKDGTYDKNIENVLLDRSDIKSLDEATKVALSEEREAQKAAESEEAAQSTDETAAETEQAVEPEETNEDTSEDLATDEEEVAEPDTAETTEDEADDNPVVREIQKGLAQRVQDISDREKQADTSSAGMPSPLSLGQPINYEQVAIWEPELGRSLAPMDGVINRDILVANEARKRALREQIASEKEAAVSEEASQPATSTRVPVGESWNAATKENFKEFGRWAAATFWKNRRWGAERRPQDSQSSTNERRLPKRWRGRLAVGTVATAAVIAAFLTAKSQSGPEHVDNGSGKVATSRAFPDSAER